MAKTCCVFKCNSRSHDRHGKKINQGVRFFRFPTWKKSVDKRVSELTKRRRMEWIAAVRRKDISFDSIPAHKVVCSRHFHEGKPAYEMYDCHYDWVPSLHLGHDEVKKTHPERFNRRRKRQLAAAERICSGAGYAQNAICSDQFITHKKAEMYDDNNPDWAPTVNMGYPRRQPLESQYQPVKRCDKQVNTDAASTLLLLSKVKVESEDSYEKNDGDCLSGVNVKLEDPPEEKRASSSSQTDTTGSLLDAVFSELQQLRTENLMLKQELKSSLNRFEAETFQGNDEKVRFFTGLTSYTLLMALFSYLEPFLPKSSIQKFPMMMMALMRLRLNLSYTFLAFLFNVHHSTVSNIVSKMIDIMYVRLKPLVIWPDRDTLQKSMPIVFQRLFKTKCAMIIHCFEVLIDKPSNTKARAATWSSQKQHNTVKFLLGVTPQGVISYISRSWGGQVSDEHMTNNCGILDHISPGDIVLADKVFDVQSNTGSFSPDLKIPAFIKEQSHLSPLDTECARKLALVRFPIERAVSIVKRKYTILNGTLQVALLMCRDGDLPEVDKITHICCSLVNLCEPAVSN